MKLHLNLLKVNLIVHISAYDNGAGSVILVKLFEYFYNNKPTRTVRFIWCGSEEMGLLGSKAHVKLHEEELDKYVYCCNLYNIHSFFLE